MHRRARIGMDFADLPCNAFYFYASMKKKGLMWLSLALFLISLYSMA